MTFTHSLWRPLGAIFAILSFSNGASADNTASDPSITIEKEIQHFVVQRDGTFLLNHETIQLINEERGIKRVAQHPLRYNRTLETLEITEAYTQKPDGRKVPVTGEMIKEQQEPASAGAPMFQDTLIKTVIFPEVAVGDRLVLRYQRNRTTALFPDQFEDLTIPSFHPIRELTLIYDLPENMPLHADAIGFKASEPAASKGRRLYRWDYVFVERARLEKQAVAFIDYGQRLAVSTFPDYATFARAYEARAADKIVVTPKIRELAEKIAGKIDNPRAQAIALSDWVRRNIRYVAVYLGAGGVVPHAADTILDNRYGDCKDHAVLLNALLAARGIEGTSALINAGTAYRWPKVPTLGVLNHAIAYVPALDLYLDPTAKGSAAGFLPAQELDKPTVLSRNGGIGHTPKTQAAATTARTVFRVQSNGAAQLTHTLTDSGWGAEYAREIFRNIKESDRNRIAEHLLLKFGQKGSGKIEVGNLESTAPEFTLIISAQSENLVNLPGPIGVPTLTTFAGGTMDAVFNVISERERKQDYLCVRGQVDEEARFEFPEAIEIVAIPKAATVRDGFIEYSSNYIREDNMVTVRRQYRSAPPSMVCSPETFTKLRPTYDAIVRDLRSQIIVQTR